MRPDVQLRLVRIDWREDAAAHGLGEWGVRADE